MNQATEYPRRTPPVPAAEPTLYAFIPEPPLSPADEGRRIAGELKAALRRRVEGHGLRCVDYGAPADLAKRLAARPAPSPASVAASGTRGQRRAKA